MSGGSGSGGISTALSGGISGWPLFEVNAAMSDVAILESREVGQDVFVRCDSHNLKLAPGGTYSYRGLSHSKEINKWGRTE